MCFLTKRLLLPEVGPGEGAKFQLDRSRLVQAKKLAAKQADFSVGKFEALICSTDMTNDRQTSLPNIRGDRLTSLCDDQ